MARLWMSGAEIDAGSASALGAIIPDGKRVATATVSRDTVVFRSGVASFKFDSGAGGTPYVQAPVTYVDGVSYWVRAYCRATAAPSGAAPIICMSVSSVDPRVRFRTDGGVELLSNNVAQGSPSASIADSNWHRVELGTTTAATGNWSASELLVDGVSIATWSGTQARSASPVGPDFGWVVTPGAGNILNMDDLAINDSTGSVNNSYPGAGAVLLLKPTADSAVGTGWVLGNNTAISSNGFGSVDNTPPLGIADLGGAGADTGQIRNATSAASSNYDATMTTYTAAGVGASDTLNAIVAWVATAAPASTAAKVGTVGIVSNPAVANISLAAAGTSGAFWSGTLGGTYGSGWKWSPGTMTEQPSVTLGTAPVMRVTQTTASTRIAVVCGMFIYVDYTPVVAAVAARIPNVNMATLIPA